jgi:2,3-bisphosphoglycerate-independent phosphoglycerate mutase
LYKGIAKVIGMDIIDVKGATGTLQTNLEAKFTAAKNALKRFDFVFVHIKATDSCGEDGNFIEKKKFIERIDKAIKIVSGLEDTLIVVTADHSTPCALKKHSADPVPILINGLGVRVDNVQKFNEIACSQGYLGHIIGQHLMPEIINILGKSSLTGN